MNEVDGIRCYGQPEDCRGWRQFQIDRPCPSPQRLSVKKVKPGIALPVVVWVSVEPIKCRFCGAVAFRIHPSSEAEICVSVPVGMYTAACFPSGRFIE